MFSNSLVERHTTFGLLFNQRWTTEQCETHDEIRNKEIWKISQSNRRDDRTIYELEA